MTHSKTLSSLSQRDLQQVSGGAARPVIGQPLKWPGCILYAPGYEPKQPKSPAALTL